MKTACLFVHTMLSRRSSKTLCLSGLIMAMSGCVSMHESDGFEDSADIEVADDGVAARMDEEDVAESVEALSTIGFSTFVGTSGSDDFFKPGIDAIGNVYVAGSMPVTNNGRDILIAKYSSTGVLLWAKSFGFAANEDVTDVAVDAAGNTYVLAKTNSFGTTQTILVTKFNNAGTVLFSVRFGGSGNDEPRGIAVDPSGSIYVAGRTSSSDFPTLNAYQPAYQGNHDAFVTKLDPSAAGLVYSTFLGGSGADDINDIAVDPFGFVYIVGNTESMVASVPFPTTIGAFRTTPVGKSDAFVTEIVPNGLSLYYSTFLGGTLSDRGMAIAVDGSYNAYVTGLTQSSNFPTTIGAFRTTRTNNTSLDETFAVRLNEPGNALVYSTYLPSTGTYTPSIAVTSTGRTYVAGGTTSNALPVTTNAFQKVRAGQSDGFLIELSATGTSAPYVTFVGGSNTDTVLGLVVDAYGNAFMAGKTQSANFPTYGAAQPTYGGIRDGFLMKFNGP